MTDAGLISLFLLLHIGAAIVAFGPVFTFPVIGAMGAKEPMHANFGVRVSATITDRFTIPLALTMPVTGLLLIWFAHFDLTNRAYFWLDLGILLYIITLSIALLIQRPTVMRVVAMTTRPPAGAPGGGGAPGGPPAGGPPAGGPPPGGAPAGPPPELRAAISKVQRTGMVLTLLIVSIVTLMVVKPQF